MTVWQENSRAELLEKFNKCNKDTLVELIRSFDMTGSKANRKEELVTKLMEFFKVHCPDTNSAYLDKVQFLNCKLIWSCQFV
jgi:endonuclease III-like uncharacterized protein